jgi:hypothetical protein
MRSIGPRSIHSGDAIVIRRLQLDRSESPRPLFGFHHAMSTPAKIPRIARIWRGCTPRQRADEYEAYNYEEGIKPLIKKAIGVQTFREDRELETEFVTISYWESVEAMALFTGGNPTEVHHLPRDEEFLIELPKRVQILRLLKSHGTFGAG